MAEPLPPEIILNEVDGVVRYTLPRRSMAGLEFIPLLIGLGLLGAGLFARTVIPSQELLFYYVFCMGFPVFGAAATIVGINGLLGRVVLELDRERFRVSSRILGIGWWRSRPTGEVMRLDAVRTPAEINDVPVTSGPFSTLSDLVAIGPGGRPFRLASSYDLRLTRPLAADLNRRLAAYRSPMQ